MFGEVIRLWENGEYSYPLACGFVPNLVSYIHEDEKIRPCMIIVPGGGYRFVSQREGEIVARTFYDKGYNTFVLTYTTDLTMTEPLKEQPMKDLACHPQDQAGSGTISDRSGKSYFVWIFGRWSSLRKRVCTL